jgi:UDP-3-O-[3-hydroxymyristoyl] glucosamine N-acyltransferase
MTVREIAAWVAGRVEGDAERAVTGVAGLEEAGPGDVAFLANPRYGAQMAATRAAAVVVADAWRGETGAALIRVADPDAAFAEIVDRLLPPDPRPEPGVHSSAVLASDVVLGPDVAIGPHAVLSAGVRVGARTRIGAGCVLGPGTVIGADGLLYPLVSTREGTRIGDRVIIHNGAVIGSDGFGYVPVEGGWKKIRQAGVVVIGDDVEIGANVTIDRARFGRTVIGDGVKIDNLVQIAHNVVIEAGSAIAAQTGISGSTRVGRGVRMGGQTGVVGHVTVGDGAVCGGQAGVTKDVPPGVFVSGYPAMAHDKAMRLHAHLMRLPEMRKTVHELERRIAALELRSAPDAPGTGS